MNNDSNSGSDREDNERRDSEERRKQSVPVENDRRLVGDDRRKV
tara:strand:- start:1010 stop:1141 length:132 start_codon:yes stop_codon:yes gene_type:complete